MQAESYLVEKLAKIAMLIGLEPASVVKHDELNRWGFIFTKCAERSGREVNWAVKRPK